MQPSSVGQIHDAFTKYIDLTTQQAQQQAAAAHGSGIRPWQVPDDVPDILDVTKVAACFDRSEIGSNYEEALSNPTSPGTVGDVISLTVQSDVLHTAERAWRARYASPIRCLAHAMARRAGHGSPSGHFQKGILKHAQDTLEAGK